MGFLRGVETGKYLHGLAGEPKIKIVTAVNCRLSIELQLKEHFWTAGIISMRLLLNSCEDILLQVLQHRQWGSKAPRVSSCRKENPSATDPVLTQLQ